MSLDGNVRLPGATRTANLVPGKAVVPRFLFHPPRRRTVCNLRRRNGTGAMRRKKENGKKERRIRKGKKVFKFVIFIVVGLFTHSFGLFIFTAHPPY